MIHCIAFNKCRRICAYGTAFLLSLSLGCATEPEHTARTESPEPQSVSNAAIAVYFEDVGQTLGLDFENVSGGPEQGYILETISAGVAFFDSDEDGYLDIFFANGMRLEGETVGNHSRLYRSTEAATGERVFRDVSQQAGVDYSGWGMGGAVGDYDNDGDADIYVANDSEVNVLYRNDGNWNLVDTAIPMGVGFSEGGRAQAGMGIHGGDYDNDGDPDLLVANLNDRPALLRNDGGNAHNWLGLKLVGVQSNKDAIGARVRVWAGDLVQTKEVQRGYGFHSQHDERLLFGLGRATSVDQVEIRWSSGLKQVIRNPLLRRYLIVHEGSDQIAAGTEVPAVAPAVRASASQVRESDVVPQVTGAPDWGPADYRRSSEVLFKQGRYLEAQAMLQKALEQDPEYIPTYINLGLVLFSGLGEFDAARKVLEQAVQIKPTRADAHHLLGKVYLHQQRLPEAIKALGQATLLKPQDWEHAHWLGLAYLRADSLVAAAGAFRDAARRAVWDPKPHLHLAQLYASKGQHEQAVKEQALFERLSLVQNRVELYERKVADYPENARAHYLLGLTYVEQGRLALGLQFFERALALDPSYAPAFHGKGRVLYQRNQITQAIRAYERACQLDTQLYDAFNDLGQAYHQSGRYDRAVTAYRRSLEIKPDLALVHSNLGLARLKGSTRRVSGWQGNARAKTTLGGTLSTMHRL